MPTTRYEMTVCLAICVAVATIDFATARMSGPGAKRDVKIEGGVDAGRLYWVIEDGRVLIGLNTDANAQVVLRHIPNPPTYNQLFKVPLNNKYFDHIHNFEVGAVLPLGPALPTGAQLVRDSSNGAVYLTDFDGARHVTSPSAFDKYHFNWNKVVGISHATANSLKKGRDIS